MSDNPAPAPNSATSSSRAGDRLDSWKEIASYLRRDERTVRRWEKKGLPVHRHQHQARAAVFAYKSELDAWWKQDRSAATEAKQSDAAASLATSRWRPQPLVIAAGVASCLILLVITRALFFGGHVSSASPPLALTPFMSLAGEFSYPAFSPDGKQVAFAWSNREAPKLGIFVKGVGGDAPLRLTFPKQENDFAPAWSPDGSVIAFLRRSDKEAGIFLVPAPGGPEQRLLELRPDGYYGLDWSADGEWIAFAQRTALTEPYSICLLSPKTKAQRQITFPQKGSFGEVQFAISPDSQTIAFIRHEPTTRISIYVTPLVEATQARKLASYTEWVDAVGWSADGQSLIVSGVQQGVRKLWRLNLSNGQEINVTEAGEDTYFPAVAKQGSRLVFVRETVHSELWRTELVSPYGPGKPPVHVISSTRAEGAPRFSPDGKRLAFQSYRSGGPEIWLSDPDGSNAVQLTHLRTAKPEMPSWSPDGRTIAFGDGGAQLISANGGQPRILVADGKSFIGPSWSRNGEHIYFWRKARGEEAQIWSTATRGGAPTQVTTNGGQSSMESPDGVFLYYTKEKTPGIWRLPVSGGPEDLVVKDMRSDLPGYWAVFDDGIYYARTSDTAYEIAFYSFAARQSKLILHLDGELDAWFGGMTVSPDRRWIVFSQQSYSSSELVLAENFR